MFEGNMRCQRTCFIISLFLIFIIFNLPGNAQDTTAVVSESKITISSEVDKKEVPLNRQVICSVIVELTGNLKRYQISDIENPIVENLEIVKTSAADRRLSEGGVAKAARIYEFVLQPKSRGMAYVENVIVKYIDNETGEGESLITPRLSVKVLDPVPEPGSNSWIIKWIILAIVIVAIFITILIWRKRVQERKRKEAEAVKVIALEDEYLSQLRESVNLKSPEIKVNETFWLLSKIARKYLSQKYQIPALESTTEKIGLELSKINLDQTLLNNIQEILTVSDLAKFAGSEGNRSELDRIYTLFEAILERNLGEAKAGSCEVIPLQ
jgi:hypothetical protein